MNLTTDFLSIEFTSAELVVDILFLQCRHTPEKRLYKKWQSGSRASSRTYQQDLTYPDMT